MFRLPVSCLTFHKRGAKAQKVPEGPKIYPLVDCWTQTRLYEWEQTGICEDRGFFCVCEYTLVCVLKRGDFVHYTS